MHIDAEHAKRWWWEEETWVVESILKVRSYTGKVYCISGFYPSIFLQPVCVWKNSILNEFWNSISSSLFKHFFVYLSRKTLDRFFILLHHCFYSCKLQICTKQTGLTIRFAIPQKKLCSCVKKIKNKHDGGADVAFFASVVLVIA